MSLSLEDNIWLPDWLELRQAERIQILIRTEVEESEPEVIPLNLEGECDGDLSSLVVNVVDVEDFTEEGNGGRATWCHSQHVQVVVGGKIV